LLLLCWCVLAASLLSGQTTLNMSHDLVPLGIASTNLVPNQPSLDAGPLFMQAVAYAKNHGISTVIADLGTYYFLSVLDNTHVALSQISNMTIDFQGSNLIFTHPLFYGMVFYFGTNLTLQNFTVDYQPLSFTQLRVVAVDVPNQQIQYTVQPGWQDPSTYNSLLPKPSEIQVHIFRNGRPVLGRLVTQLPLTGDRLPIINPPQAILPAIRPGDIAVLLLRLGIDAINANHCNGCTFRNITVFSADATGVAAYQVKSLTMERVYALPKPGTDRLMSVASAIAFTPLGPNNQIRLSRAIRTNDDGFAFTVRYTGTVQNQIDSRHLTIVGTPASSLESADSVANGSLVNFQRVSDGFILGSAVIVTQTAPSGSPNQVTFTFDRDLPSNLVGAFMYSADAAYNGGNTVLERNSAQSLSCCRGINGAGLANSIIRGNYLQRTSFSAVHLEQSTSPGEPASPPFVNLNVSNNVIDGTNTNSDWWWFQLGAIQAVTLDNPSFLLFPNSVFSNINVTNNFIADAGRSAVWMGDTAGGSVSGNYFLNPNARPDLANALPFYLPDATLPLVIDTTSSGISTSNNTIDNTSGRMFVTDTQYRELAAYAPGGTIRLNAYNLGTLANPSVTLTDADGITAALTIQKTAAHAIEVQLPAAAGLGGAYVTLTSGSMKYFGTLFLDSQDNIPAVNGCTYETSVSSTSAPGGASSLPILVVTQAGCVYQVLATDAFVNPGSGAAGTAVISVGFAANTGPARSATIEIAGQPITLNQAALLSISVNRTSLNYGYSGNTITSPQPVVISFSNHGPVAWSVQSSVPNITVSPSNGTGAGTFLVTAAPGASGVLTITAAGAANSPTIQVNVASVTPAPPFGSFDTPADNTNNIAGAIPISGWALNKIEVSSVGIWREKVGNEPVASNGLVFIGNATLVADARPDVLAANTTLPWNYRAGWGYLLLTNFLPNTSGSGPLGNGTYKLHVIAVDKTNLSTDLGTRTIIVDNAHANKPFGTIDTPSQGGDASGNQFVNFGWALTPNPACIPTNGSTLTVTVDGVTLGSPAYNQNRSDIANSFPGYCNSTGAVGFFYIDTTKLTNGVHTIGWLAYDNQGRGDGLGSRFFNVLNSSSGSAEPEPVPFEGVAPHEMTLRRGFNLNKPAERFERNGRGEHVIEIEELGRIELHAGVVSGYQLINGERADLPTGSTIQGGVFYWQAGPGFLGDYSLVLNRSDGRELRPRVTIIPKTNAGQDQ
jgi:hypothetical protein